MPPAARSEVRPGQGQGMMLDLREMPPCDATRRSGQGKNSGRERTLLKTVFAGQGFDQAACFVDLSVG